MKGEGDLEEAGFLRVDAFFGDKEDAIFLRGEDDEAVFFCERNASEDCPALSPLDVDATFMPEEAGTDSSLPFFACFGRSGDEISRSPLVTVVEREPESGERREGGAPPILARFVGRSSSLISMGAERDMAARFRSLTWAGERGGEILPGRRRGERGAAARD